MNAIPDLTPPGKSGKTTASKSEEKRVDAQKAEKPAKEPKVPKEPKPAADPNAPKAPRAARQDYGFRPDAVLTVVKDKDVTKLRGHRKAWYDKIVAFDGKQVQEFTEANKENSKDPPRGWVRFFAQDGFITLSGGTVPAPKSTKVDTPATTPDTPPTA